MNIYITSTDTQAPSHFEVIKVGVNSVNFDNIPANSCSQIIVERASELFDDPVKFLSSCFNLLRKDGTIKILGIDLRTVCLSYVNGQMDSKTFNKSIINDHRSALSCDELLNAVKSLGMHVHRCDTQNNALYELLATRK